MSERPDRVAMISDLDAVVQRLEKRITEEGTLTRAHFNIMVEKVNDSVRLVAGPPERLDAAEIQ
jgi:hypothetical protein